MKISHYMACFNALADMYSSFFSHQAQSKSSNFMKEWISYSFKSKSKILVNLQGTEPSTYDQKAVALTTAPCLYIQIIICYDL